MSSSTIAMIFLVALAAFFILLVILTIVVIVSKSNSKTDNTSDKENNNEDYDEDYDEEYNEPEKIRKPKSKNQKEAIHSEADIFEEAEQEADKQFRNDDITEELTVPDNSAAYEDADVEAEAVETEQNSEEETEAAETEQNSEEETEAAEAEQDAISEQLEEIVDSAFAPEPEVTGLTDELIAESVREAEAMAAVVIGSNIPAETMFGISEEMSKYGGKKKNSKKSSVSSDEDFYWYNKMDVAQKPSYKTAEMYYHYFNLPQECIEDLLVEMYDCALVRTEEIKYIAYGIEPRAVSMKEILSYGNSNYKQQQRLKEPTVEDLVRIYEKWCGYVDKLFDKVEIHADEPTIEAIRKLLCEYGRSDVDVLIEGK